MPSENAVLPGGEKFHWIDGHYVQDDALRIANKINEYDPNLRVQYLAHAADLGDPPFRVVENCRDGVERTVCYAWELDDRLYDRVVTLDTMGTDLLKVIDKNNEQQRQRVKKEHAEKNEEAKEIITAVAKSPKDTYTVKSEILPGDEPVKFRSTPG